MPRGGRPPAGSGPPGSGRPPGPGGPPPGYHPDDAPTELVEPATETIDPRHQPEPALLTHADAFGPEHDAGLAAGLDDGDLDPDEEQRLRRKKIWRRVRRTCYVLAAAGILGPIIGFVVAYQFVSVPDPQEVAAKQQQVVTLYYANGQEMGKINPEGGARVLVKYEQIPDQVRHAVEAAEDASFEDPSNHGFDMKSIVRAVWIQATGGASGGSGITQQYIKQATGNDQHTITRKFFEVVKAYKMSQQQSKEDIITAYLNTIYLGRGAYGIQAAAQTYFKKDVGQLSPEEAAYLAGLIQAPGRSENRDYVQTRWNYVMDQMAKNRWVDPAERQSATLPTPIPQSQSRASQLSGPARLIKNQIEAELDSRHLTWDQVQLNGAKVYTTIDPKAQKAAEDAARQVMAADAKTPSLATALTAVNPRTGGIIAWYGGDDPGYYDLATLPQPPGSSFKPFVFLAAMENNPQVGINSLYDGSDNQQILGQTVHNSDGETCGPLCTVKTAMTESVNTVFYKMGADTGTAKVRDAALQAGIPEKIRDPARNTSFPSLLTVDDAGRPAGVEAGISIGQYPVRPMDMAAAYATLANNGMKTTEHFVNKVEDSTGNVMYQAPAPAPQPAFDPSDPDHNAKLARNVTEAMLDVAQHSGVPLDNGRPVAAKTGTVQFKLDNKDTGHNMAAWMAGYTPSVAAAVWVGNKDKPGPIFGNYRNTIGPSHNYDIYGREEPSYIWQLFMNNYLKGTKIEQFPPFVPLGTNSNFSGHPTEAPPPPSSTPESTPPTTSSETSSQTETSRPTKSRPPHCGLFGCPTTEPPTTTSTNPFGAQPQPGATSDPPSG
ncbi:transglycosylase domain-containing protein [Gandjariella thermophila]|nr:transglycosylase domain-containing protein [Gandjariella thermophila]